MRVALLMLRSVTNQVLAQVGVLRKLKENKAYKNDVYLLPKELDEEWRNCTFLHSVRSSPSSLKNKQVSLDVKVERSFKGEHNRFSCEVLSRVLSLAACLFVDALCERPKTFRHAFVANAQAKLQFCECFQHALVTAQACSRLKWVSDMHLWQPRDTLEEHSRTLEKHPCF